MAAIVYNGNSRITGKGRVPVHVIDYWINVNAMRVAERNKLHDYKVPAGIAKAYVDLGKLTGLNHDLMVAQAAKETAYFTSRIFRDKLNPAGLGAENDNPYDKAITFTTVEDGVRAQYAHMLSYIHGDGHLLQEYSVRHERLRSVGYLGIVRVLSDLNQRWAWSLPDVYEATPNHLRYGQSIASWANALVTLKDSFDDINGGSPVVEIEIPYHKDIGVRVREDGPFADYYRWLIAEIGYSEALMILGFPITEEFTVGGVTMQYFERARMEHHPGKRPDRFDVLLGHLGREDVQLKDDESVRGSIIDKIEDYLKKLR